MGNHKLLLTAIFVAASTILVSGHQNMRQARSIDLAAANTLISDTKLPKEVTPISYGLDLRPNIEESTFTGVVRIMVNFEEQTNKIALHAHSDLEINKSDVKVTHMERTPSDEEFAETVLEIQRVDRHPKKPTYTIHLKEPLKQGTVCQVQIAFTGTIWTTSDGLFKSSYIDELGVRKNYIATHMRPNNARLVFPCFDEPGYKVPFQVSISRPKTHTTLFNMPVEKTEEEEDFAVDYFVKSPPMSTFTFGFLTSQLPYVNTTVEYDTPQIRIWGRKALHEDLQPVYEKVKAVIAFLNAYWGVNYPLCKLDVVALPGFVSVKPADNWGLLFFKESELTGRGYYLIAQEMVYQWLGAWVTPYWWSDAHINKAIAGFLAASASLEIDNGLEFDGKWPMTILYSNYYEFSKRYPHSRITGMKQETTCSKTELVLRMLNYTLGPETFKLGLQRFFQDRALGTFFGDDVWDALTKEALVNNTTPSKNVTVKEIAGSWITKDRLPVVTVTRNYKEQTALVSQRVYLRERPHDVPEQDKMLWWIPLVVVTEDSMDFTKPKVMEWLPKTRNITLNKMPTADKFIIVNPEEIGPFPVNYDLENWNLLSKYLQTEAGRNAIPAYTKAKLLHDAWNLAYAGDLSFATAFNMTLFMKWEKEHIVWNPVFTLIDHIGRHIDMSAVHRKFETYVRMLLTPLYKSLGERKEGEENWKENLRSLCKNFLCRAGYRPCIEEAQAVYRQWMDSDHPDEGNPVSNQYICPVFKWGTMEEWEFGLQRIINFPASRIQSERTYLLKTLAGCPIQIEKIERLLNITILEENGNFTEIDINTIFNMLSGGSSGYITMFNFLSQNWDAIKHRFENKVNLWDHLISSATGDFTTQEGYDMVSALYVQRQGEFGSAEHIIEKSLRNIKEETKWSDENLPVIEKWLDDYLATVNTADVQFMG